MNPNHVMYAPVAGFQPLSENEMEQVNGGGVWGVLFDVSLFFVSPALGMFNLGVKAGLNEARNEARDEARSNM
jgi:bacteriocin-like protein